MHIGDSVAMDIVNQFGNEHFVISSLNLFDCSLYDKLLTLHTAQIT